MEFAPLHKVPEFQRECAEVLNEEWKRSLTARLHSLEKSRDTFPVCLVLLERAKDGKQYVLGQSMLSVVRGQSVQSCLVESVVVRKSLRGKGYGRIIMQKTEEFAARKGYEVMYLTTHDKQKFYEHLGYEYCSPVVTFSSDILPEHLASKLIGSLAITTPGGDNDAQNEKSTNKLCKETKTSNPDKDRSNPARLCENNSTEAEICQSPPSAPTSPPVAPPPPPVAPPPPPPTNSSSLPDKSGDKKVTKWDPSLVSWMKKRIV